MRTDPAAELLTALVAVLDKPVHEANYKGRVAGLVTLTPEQLCAMRITAERHEITLPEYPFDLCAYCGHQRHYHQPTYVYPRAFWDQWEGKRLPREVLLNELPKLRRAPGPIRCSPHHSPTGPLPTVGAGDVLNPYPEPDYDAGCDCAGFQPQEDAG